MALTLAKGADAIIASRRKDQKPSDLVIVSLVGFLPDGNPVVVADSADHDWRWCRELEVCIFGKVGTPNRQVAIAIGMCLPSRLYLWDVEAKQGTDVTVHVKLDSLNKPAGSLKASDWTAILSPWTDWQNKKFEEDRA